MGAYPADEFRKPRLGATCTCTASMRRTLQMVLCGTSGRPLPTHRERARQLACPTAEMLWLLPEELALQIILQLHPHTLARLNYVSAHFLPTSQLQQGLVEQALRCLFRVGACKLSCIALHRLALHPDCRRVASGWCCIQTPSTLAWDRTTRSLSMSRSSSSRAVAPTIVGLSPVREWATARKTGS